MYTKKKNVHKKKLCTQKKLSTQKKTYVHKKNKKKQTYICFVLFFVCAQILGLIISHCVRKPVFGMLWILDLELLLLISRIARRWNRSKTCFVRSHYPPKNPFLLKTRDFSRMRFAASQRRLQENVFTRANLFGGAILLFPPI